MNSFVSLVLGSINFLVMCRSVTLLHRGKQSQCPKEEIASQDLLSANPLVSRKSRVNLLKCSTLMILLTLNVGMTRLRTLKLPPPLPSTRAQLRYSPQICNTICCRLFSSKPMLRFAKMIRPAGAAEQGRFRGGVRLLLQSPAARRNREPRKPPS